MWELDDYNNGLIYTNIDKCIDCNKCIHECPVLKSNVLTISADGQHSMCVDEKECILCGTCINTCVHGSRHYRDDCDDFFMALERGRSFSVIVAPSFFLNYPDMYKHIFGYLKNLGVKNFYPASFGADITVWGYLNYLKGNEKAGYISQPCPSIVRHIEKHQPELLSNLMPIQSPVMCTAIYLKKYLGIKEELAFISPCISKKIEIESKRGQGLIRHNVTFKNLMDTIKKRKIVLPDCPPVDVALETDMGCLFPLPGGLRENIEFYLEGKASVLQVEGEHSSYQYLRHLANQDAKRASHIPTLIDILNCDRGCCYGTGSEFRDADNYDVAYRAAEMRRAKYSDMAERKSTIPDASQERITQLNKRFEDLKLEDFMCEYVIDHDSHFKSISDSEIDVILSQKLFKHTDNDKHVDCSACGYKTCKNMAEAIALGINHQDNCVYFVKNTLAESTQMMEQRLKAMLDASPVLCAIFDDNFNITEVNQEAANMLRLSDKQEYIDRFFELSPKYQPDGTNSKEKASKAVRHALQSGRGYLPEWIHIAYDGEQIPVEVHLKRVKLGGKYVVIVYGRDLREEKRMLKKLEEAVTREQAANNAKTKFLSTMSHEIRTPMNSVLGIAELQLQKDIHPPETEEAFARIYSSSNLLLTIINDILDLSKVEAGKLEVIPAPYDLSSMIVDTVQLNLMAIGSKKIDFKLIVDENLPKTLIGDEVRLKQILNNIVSNAIKYTQEGFVHLNFSAEPSPAKDGIILVVSVRDSGQGLTREQAETIFSDEFKRYNLRSNRAIEGSGLGLVIVNNLISMMDGEISVESDPGCGSTFTIRLPQSVDSASRLGADVVASLQNLEDAQRALKTISKLNREPMPYGRVLVVDDVESNLYVARGFLMPYKLIIDTSTCGSNVISKIESGETYDIIFMDHMMPDMDGIETAKKLRAMGYDKPIIALTATALNDSKKMFTDNGFSGFISKPIDISELDKYLLQFIRDKQSFEVIENARLMAAKQNKDFAIDGTLPRMLVDSFLRDAKTSSKILEACAQKQTLDKNALKSYVVQAHAMKSALLNINKPKLASIAAALEAAGREPDFEYIQGETPRFIALLKAVVMELEYSQLHNVSAEDEDPTFLREQLLIIRQACENYNIDAADSAFEAVNRKACSQHTKELFSTLADHILCCELEEAIELIDNAINAPQSN